MFDFFTVVRRLWAQCLLMALVSFPLVEPAGATPPDLHNCESLARIAHPQAHVLIGLSYALSENVQRLSSYINKLPPKPNTVPVTDPSDFSEIADNILKQKTTLLYHLELECKRRADKAESDAVDFLDSAPEHVKNHSDHWQNLYLGLPNRIKLLREQEMYPLKLASEVLSLLDSYRQFTLDKKQIHPQILHPKTPKLSESKMATRLDVETLAKQWSEATDPIANADPPTSRFLVLGIDRDPFNMIFKSLTIARLLLAGVRVHPSYWIDNLTQPERIWEKQTLSLSYVGPHKRVTYAKSGFILKVPQKNILATYFSDSGNPIYGSFPNRREELEKRTILGPDELLSFTNIYNEVNVTGEHPDGSKVEVIGAFIRTDRNGKPLISPEEVEWWKNYCKVHKFPAPAFIQDSLHDSLEERSRAMGWLTAVRLVKRQIEKTSGDLREWGAEIREELRISGDLSSTGPQLVERYLTAENIGPSRFRLTTKWGPPEMLRWPHDDMITFEDYLKFMNEVQERNGKEISN